MIRVLLVLLAASWFVISSAHNPAYAEHWESYKKKHGKSYEGKENDRRRKTWESHLDTINKHNEEYKNRKHKFKMATNEYSDMEGEEFRQKMTGLVPYHGPPAVDTFRVSSDVKLLKFVDWRKCGAVAAVKNQRMCGSCYAFSTVAALEGYVKLKTGQLRTLSEQNIIDCSDNYGCGGGSIQQAFAYVEKNGGIETEMMYPYKAKNGTCYYKRGFAFPSLKNMRFVKIEANNEVALQAAIAIKGPVAVSFNAHLSTFQNYGEGIYDDPACESNQIDHAVVAVGFGTENGTDYWLIKNSYGTSWGENGFMKLARNRGNLCGIATDSYFPEL